MGILEVFCLISLHIIFATAAAAEKCPISACSGDKIPVRFPFLLEGQQPQGCAYPGFNLSCNNQNRTVLKLPYSGDFLVRSINYLMQQIQLYDSDDCLPKRLLHLSLLGSPFAATFYQNYTFLSCPTQVVTSRFTTIDCLSNSTTSILAISSANVVSSISSSCQILVTLPIPVSWPVQNNGGFSSKLSDDLQLTWYSPDCQACETQGGICGFQGNNSLQVGCSYNSDTGRSTGALEVFKVICMSVAVPALILAAGITAFAYFMDRTSRGNRANTRQQNTTIAAVSPEPTVVVGLDEPTIESYQKLVLGESKRLPGPNDSTCAICLSEYCSKETVRCIPECKHCFHADCIDKWLRMNSSCPVCRNSPSPAHVRSSTA